MMWRHSCVPHIHDIDDLLLLIVSVNKFDTLLNMNKPIQVFLVFQQWLRSSRLWILAYSLNLLLYRLYALHSRVSPKGFCTIHQLLIPV